MGAAFFGWEDLRRGRRAGSEDGLGKGCEGRAPAGQAAAGGFGAKAPASAEPKRPAGVFGLHCGVQRGDGAAGFLLTMTLFAVIMELHSTKKERIP